MNWEQCARTGAWSSGLSILQMLLPEQSQRQNQCPSWCLPWPGTPGIFLAAGGNLSSSGAFLWHFLFLVKEMTSDPFSVIKPPPELQGFTEISGRFSWGRNAWRVEAGGDVAAVPAGLPTNIHHNTCVEAQRETLRAGREQSSQLFFCRYFAAGTVGFLFVLWDFGCVGETSKGWWCS